MRYKTARQVKMGRRVKTVRRIKMARQIQEKTDKEQRSTELQADNGAPKSKADADRH